MRPVVSVALTIALIAVSISAASKTGVKWVPLDQVQRGPAKHDTSTSATTQALTTQPSNASPTTQTTAPAVQVTPPLPVLYPVAVAAPAQHRLDLTCFGAGTANKIKVTTVNSYLLRPTEDVPSGENQMVPLGREPNRLVIAQEAVGAVFPVTAARPLLFVEGSDRVTVKAYSDKQILTFLDSRFHLLNVIPNNGKDECLRALESARSVLKDQPFGLRVFALLDRDLDTEEAPAEGAYLLPCAMIENLLFSIPALRAGFGAMLHRTAFEHDDEALRAALDEAVKAAEAAEVTRRFRRKVRFSTFGPDRLVVDSTSAASYRDEFKERLDVQDFNQIEQEARREVEEIVAAGTQLKLFSGKAILNEFFERNVSSLAMSKAMFVYGGAQEAASDAAVREFLQRFFDAIGVG